MAESKVTCHPKEASRGVNAGKDLRCVFVLVSKRLPDSQFKGFPVKFQVEKYGEIQTKINQVFETFEGISESPLFQTVRCCVFSFWC